MALTGIQIFKLLPKTNCGVSKYPTCLAIAMALDSSKAEIDACPYITDEGRLQLSEASAPPIRQVSIGSSDYEIKISKSGSAFIPPCTKNVFLKYYNPLTNNLREWDKTDAEAYEKNIKDTLQIFLN